MRILILNIFIALIFSTIGCGKFLDMVPERDIETIESIFEIRSSAYDFYYSCFDAVNAELSVGHFAKDPSILNGGEYVSSKYMINKSKPTDIIRIPYGSQNTVAPMGDLWTMKTKSSRSAGSVYACIRYCNILIENIDNVNNMAIWEKKAWKAEIKCLKAFYYFEMVKRYGPIVLVSENIKTDEDIAKLQTPRSHVDSCFKVMVQLFDEAIPDLRTRNETPFEHKAYFNKEAAYAYKAKVLLYAASPLFNGNASYANFKNIKGENLFSSTYDPEKWRIAAEAIDEAIDVAIEGNIDFAQNSVTSKTAKLNNINDIKNAVTHQTWNDGEWIFLQNPYENNFTYYRPKYKTGNTFSNPRIDGSVSPDIATVEMFYTDNGLPIAMDKTWPFNNRYKMGREVNSEYTDIIELNIDVLNLHLRREPRFYANVSAVGAYDVFQNKLYRVEAYRGQSRGTESSRFNDGTVPQNITGYWSKKYDLNSGIPATSTILPTVLMRLSDLYLMQAEAWNEYSGPSEKVYDAVDKIRKRAGIPPIRQAWASYAYNPNEILTKEGLRRAIRQERMIEFVFEGHHLWDLKRWKEAEIKLNKPMYGWNILGENANEFFNGGTPIEVSKIEFTQRDYFWPIRSEEIMIANIVQNPGW